VVRHEGTALRSFLGGDAQTGTGSRSWIASAMASGLCAVTLSADARSKPHHVPSPGGPFTCGCRLQRHANSILSKAEMSGDLRTALAAIRELRGTIELLARVTGELQETTQVNVLVSPEYLELRTIILRTLAPYPEARVAIASALRNVGHAGA
jgi:hypothetical protein